MSDLVRHRRHRGRAGPAAVLHLLLPLIRPGHHIKDRGARTLLADLHHAHLDTEERVFWWYLATVELTDRLIQRKSGG